MSQAEVGTQRLPIDAGERAGPSLQQRDPGLATRVDGPFAVVILGRLIVSIVDRYSRTQSRTAGSNLHLAAVKDAAILVPGKE
jgi:hypothetical protein